MMPFTQIKKSKVIEWRDPNGSRQPLDSLVRLAVHMTNKQYTIPRGKTARIIRGTVTNNKFSALKDLAVSVQGPARSLTAVAVIVAPVLVAATMEASAQSWSQTMGQSNVYGHHNPFQGMTLRAAIGGGMAGMAVGLLTAGLRLLLSRHGWKVATVILTLVILVGERAESPAPLA